MCLANCVSNLGWPANSQHHMHVLLAMWRCRTVRRQVRRMQRSPRRSAAVNQSCSVLCASSGINTMGNMLTQTIYGDSGYATSAWAVYDDGRRHHHPWIPWWWKCAPLIPCRHSSWKPRQGMVGTRLIRGEHSLYLVYLVGFLKIFVPIKCQEIGS